ncbi:signal peptidase I [Natronobiforma cellulositropha]|uniref:signal peptidase I n=1 Tax=Natronobiforma cellulositropha TaxID=1679076 RepID=UPI0021D6113C|nr:signal peptidase I [Natronobiforma cellulositropha]
MNASKLGERVLLACVALVVLSLVVGHLLGQPVLLGYVTSGSMEPTIGTGDGFVAVPSALTGDPEPGDVVVFEATHLHDGGLTTHRVVDVTDEGYVTRGDANPFTDQDGGEPPVRDGQIVASALQIGDRVVTIPHLGTAVMGVQTGAERAVGVAAAAVGAPIALGGESVGALLVGVGVALLGLAMLLEGTGTRRDVKRSTVRERVLAFWVAVGLVLLVLVTLATAAMVVPSGVVGYGVGASEAATGDPQIVAPGETATVAHTVDNAGYVPVVTLFEAESPGVEATPDRLTVGARATGETTLSLAAPEQPGETVRYVGEHRYLLVLPPSVLAALHGVHPLLALAAVNAVIVTVAVGLVVLLFGAGDFRIRRPGDHVPLRTRLERKLRRRR